jgi:hypothetical protein
MTNAISAQPTTGLTQSDITTAQMRLAQPPSDYVALTPDSLLIFCQSRLKSMDDVIHKKMDLQQSFVALQDTVTTVQAKLKEYGKAGADDAVAFAGPGKINEVTRLLDSAIATAKDCGSNELASSLESVKEKLRAGDDNVLVGEVKDMNTMLDSALTTCRSSAEVSMIDMQSLISQRATTLQLTTGMMNSLNEGMKSIAGNVGR